MLKRAFLLGEASLEDFDFARELRGFFDALGEAIRLLEVARANDFEFCFEARRKLARGVPLGDGNIDLTP